MYLSTNNNKKAIGQVLLAALLIFGSLSLSAEPSKSPPNKEIVKTSVWASANQKLVLNLSAVDEGHRICPQTPDTQRQPFCRQFNVPVRGICGDLDHIYLVLANGDIHLVNSALIGVNGDFNATFHPDIPINLQSAWFIEEETCKGISLPRILGMNQNGTLLMFDGKKWQKVNEVSHLAPSS